MPLWTRICSIQSTLIFVKQQYFQLQDDILFILILVASFYTEPLLFFSYCYCCFGVWVLSPSQYCRLVSLAISVYFWACYAAFFFGVLQTLWTLLVLLRHFLKESLVAFGVYITPAYLCSEWFTAPLWNRKVTTHTLADEGLLL